MRGSSQRRPSRTRAKLVQQDTAELREAAAQKAGEAPRQTRRAGGDRFLVVGLGASAGGLEAVSKLLEALPANKGFAFVLIQHLEPTHESMLPDLLAQDTTMKVVKAADGMLVEPSHLYVIPPHAYLTVRAGMLRIVQPEARHVRLPFDFFLNSLAEEYGARAVCVVLSGTGTDGSVGLRAVSEKGGLVIVQDPYEAAFDGMPRSAIETGAANLVLPVAGIPCALNRYAQHPYVTADIGAEEPGKETEKSLTAIIALLRTRTSQDFSRYKKTTLHRRIQRRMAAAGVNEIGDYIKLLRKDDREVELLAKNLLIHVTRFFRDPSSYEALARTVIPELVRRHSRDQIRVWVPGCSTGEEAYSLAMLFFEEFAVANQSLKLRIFASDLNPEAVAFAREGIYPDSIKADVSVERLGRFFTLEDQSYRVKPDLREVMVFTAQDLLNDPPFMHLDFISCRNVLIYLQPEEQERALWLFHYAIVQGGFLFLGTSETIGSLSELFEPVPDTVRTFRRIGNNRPRGSAVAPNIITRSRALWPRTTSHVESKRHGIVDLVQHVLLDVYAPAAVLINRKYRGLFFFGPIDRYLHVATGEPSGHLLAMLRDGLASKFRVAVRQASQNHAPVTVDDAAVKRNGSSVSVSISARPLQYEGEEVLLVTFVDVPKHKASAMPESSGGAPRVKQLEEELEATREDLENTIRELEGSNQELTALNEEAASMNEEFQSTNEELETSREELQSVNEELVRVNNELRESVEQQRRSSDDLQNILNSAQVATLFLDKEFKIRFFTSAAAPLLNLIATDIGRPLADLAINFTGIDLLAAAHDTLGSSAPIKREVTSASGNWYVCSISPYRTRTNQIEGVVINFSDISELKAGEQILRAAQTYAEELTTINPRRLAVLDDELRIITASQSFYRFFGVSPENMLGRLLPDTAAHCLDTPGLRTFIGAAKDKDGGRNVKNYDIMIDLPAHGRRTLAVTVEEIVEARTKGRRILISIDDVTDFKHAMQQLAAAKEAAEKADLTKSRFLAAASHDLRQPLQSLSFLHAALRRRVKDKEAAALIAKAERTSETMVGLLSALLDINQLETGALQPELADFPIKELFDTLNNEFADWAENKGLSWRVVRCGVAVHSDRRLLEEMVRNLLSNAVRYTDTGKIMLGCRRRGNRVRIEVWDTGVGISEGQVARIFEEYSQAENGGGRGGLGLGLAIVQRLGVLLRHPINVRSRVGKGSVFSIEVPLAGASSLPAQRPRGPERKGTAVHVGNIIVIEDEPSVRDSLRGILEGEGHHVAVAANGQAALDLLARDRMQPDLVVSDYNLLGELDGVQTAAALSAALGQQVPGIILSGDIRAATLRNIAEKGYVSITKPVKAVDLVRLVRRLLAGSLPATKMKDAPPSAGPDSAATGAVFVVDDDRETRNAMRTLLSNAGYRVKTYSSALAFLDSFHADDRGCLVADVRMPGMSGLEMIARLASMGSKLPAIVVTGQGDIAMAVQAMRGGAVDFIEKPVKWEALLASIRRAMQRAGSPEERSAWRTQAAMRVAGLTKREREVMDLVVAGLANKEIAFRLGISQRTVEVHRASVMKKTGAESLSDLVRLVIRAQRGQPTKRE